MSDPKNMDDNDNPNSPFYIRFGQDAPAEDATQFPDIVDYLRKETDDFKREVFNEI